MARAPTAGALVVGWCGRLADGGRSGAPRRRSSRCDLVQLASPVNRRSSRWSSSSLVSLQCRLNNLIDFVRSWDILARPREPEHGAPGRQYGVGARIPRVGRLLIQGSRRAAAHGAGARAVGTSRGVHAAWRTLHRGPGSDCRAGTGTCTRVSAARTPAAASDFCYADDTNAAE